VARPLVLAVLAVFAVAAWTRRWVNEDGFIYFRIVDNLLAGHGPVFNVGERVETYTSPLWTALLAVLAALAPFASLAWLSVGLGLVTSLAGFAAAAAGALRLHGREGVALPLGLLVVTAVPTFWDFATSGLETGLIFGWLGATWWAVVAGRRPSAVAVLVGLGPLVRPDLAVFSLGFLALLVLSGPRSWRRAARLVAWAGAIPVAYELFRMAYFAALVPNTALAKEAGAAYWTRGAGYLAAFVVDYWLWVPLAALAALGLAAVLRGAPRGRVALVAVPVACAVVHALYVVRLGGDYMHGRMLLPSVFGALLPAAVLVLERRRAIAVSAVVVPWAVACGLFLQAPSRFVDGSKPWYDQRTTLSAEGGHAHPVTLAHYARYAFSQPTIGWRLAELARVRSAVVVDYVPARRRVGDRVVPWLAPRPLPGAWAGREADAPVLALTGSLGRLGYAAGDDVRLGDFLGLADPVGARTRLVEPRVRRPGHEKQVPAAWYLARFAAGELPPAVRPQVEAARAALACPPLSRLIAATSEPLTPRRMAANLAVAIQAHGLRVDPDPVRARAQVCGQRGEQLRPAARAGATR
jgi:arabinofuranosyltransferase